MAWPNAGNFVGVRTQEMWAVVAALCRAVNERRYRVLTTSGARALTLVEWPVTDLVDAGTKKEYPVASDFVCEVHGPLTKAIMAKLLEEVEALAPYFYQTIGSGTGSGSSPRWTSSALYAAAGTGLPAWDDKHFLAGGNWMRLKEMLNRLTKLGVAVNAPTGDFSGDMERTGFLGVDDIAYLDGLSPAMWSDVAGFFETVGNGTWLNTVRAQVGRTGPATDYHGMMTTSASGQWQIDLSKVDGTVIRSTEGAETWTSGATIPVTFRALETVGVWPVGVGVPDHGDETVIDGTYEVSPGGGVGLGASVTGGITAGAVRTLTAAFAGTVEVSEGVAFSVVGYRFAMCGPCAADRSDEDFRTYGGRYGVSLVVDLAGVLTDQV